MTKHKGETITEVMVSVTILVGVLVAGFGVLKSALATNLDVRNRIVATNIAREGIEGVRNIRDTNWLKYSGNKLEKWLCRDSSDVNNLNSCGGDLLAANQKLSIGFYKLDFKKPDNSSDDKDSRYFLIKDNNTNASAFSPDTSPPDYYRLWKKDNRYIHTSSGTLGTPFYRQIQLDTSVDSDIDRCDVGKCKLHVISRVQWKEGDAVQEVKLETYLYNYFKLDKYPTP